MYKYCNLISGTEIVAIIMHYSIVESHLTCLKILQNFITYRIRKIEVIHRRSSFHLKSTFHRKQTTCLNTSQRVGKSGTDQSAFTFDEVAPAPASANESTFIRVAESLFIDIDYLLFFNNFM